jgi:hypothetical protein
MPVGKNALKRVTNNGYSKVAVSAPDMEHSEVVKTEKATKKEESIKIEAKKNTTPKIKKPATPKPVAKKADEAKRPDGFARFELGSDLPVHLL